MRSVGLSLSPLSPCSWAMASTRWMSSSPRSAAAATASPSTWIATSAAEQRMLPCNSSSSSPGQMRKRRQTSSPYWGWSRTCVQHIKCYLHGLLDDRTAILDAWHVMSCPVRHARALPACPELFASLFVCISFWVGSLRETLLRVLEVLGMSRVRSLKMLPRQHFGNFGAGPRQPMIFGLRGTRGP